VVLARLVEALHACEEVGRNSLEGEGGEREREG
jgi:hypothetical protein